MRPKRLIGYLLLPFIALAVLTLVLGIWLTWGSVVRVERDRLASGLEARLHGNLKQAGALLAPGPDTGLRVGCQALAARLAARVTLFLPDGRVHCDTARPAPPPPETPPPEVLAALGGATGTALRQPGGEGPRVLFVAVPLESPTGIAGVARASQAMPGLDEEWGRLMGKVAVLAAGLLLLSLGVAWAVAHRLGGPMTELAVAAEGIARGEPPPRLTATGPGELQRLTRAFHEMSGEVGERARAVSQRLRDLEIVLSNMVEAVVAVDEQERIINLNPTAARLFGLGLAEARGRYLMEVVRNADLIRVVSSVLGGTGPMEGEIVLHQPHGDLALQAQGNLLRDEEGRPAGAIVVLHDVTRLRALETMRRDFVANVSHELKTPITSIKGFVETLQDGALKDPKEAERFLAIVARQADRLIAIIEDLLALSRIEQEGERGALPRRPERVAPVLRAAIQDCEKKAQEKKLQIGLDCPDDLAAPINAPLLEQALVNLLDNAIKASPAGGAVQVEGAQEEGGVRLAVRDAGPGIAAKHVERLFERFYRVDPARSRKEGGTGLGLAIVKHIAQAHGGRVEVASTPGSGSTFSLHLPG